MKKLLFLGVAVAMTVTVEATNLFQPYQTSTNAISTLPLSTTQVLIGKTKKVVTDKFFCLNNLPNSFESDVYKEFKNCKHYSTPNPQTIIIYFNSISNNWLAALWETKTGLNPQKVTWSIGSEFRPFNLYVDNSNMVTKAYASLDVFGTESTTASTSSDNATTVSNKITTCYATLKVKDGRPVINGKMSALKNTTTSIKWSVKDYKTLEKTRTAVEKMLRKTSLIF